jgi:prophage antirepressor-like protein
MNALIDLEQSREYMTIVLNETNFNVKLAGTIKTPYFCGKNICDVLDHKNYKYALRTHVPLKYKKELSYFYGQIDQDLGMGNPNPQIMVKEHHNFLGKPEISHREGQAIYISEAGLYSLINGSQDFKNKEDFIKQVEKWIVDLKYGGGSGLMDIFSFVKGYNLTFDINSNWFQDLWYPLSKNQPPSWGG